MTPSLDALNKRLRGSILTDAASRRLFAQDASPYARLPAAVICPFDAGDIASVLTHASENGIAVIPRGAGTSLAGQCVGDGLIVDTYRHLNRILSICKDTRTARVEPGVVLADLNTAAARFGLTFAPDPSTADRCAVGGMVGNNAWGAHALAYGTTRDHVSAIDAVLANGSPVHFGPEPTPALADKCAAPTTEGAVYHAVFAAIGDDPQRLLDAYPSAHGAPNNAGYALDALAGGQPWITVGEPFNLARLICGSEGTLAVATELTLKLTPIPRHRQLLCAHFRSEASALTSVAIARAVLPAAIELLDHDLLELTRDNLSQRRNRFWIEGEPEAVLLIELESDDKDTLEDRAAALTRDLQASGLAYHVARLTPPESERVWSLRRAGLGLLMGARSVRRAVTGMEDGAVPLEALPRYVAEARRLLAEHGLDAVAYGSVGMGLVHLRPWLDLTDPRERTLYPLLIESIGRLAIELGGTPSAKHGDGRLRAGLLDALYGPDIVARLRQVKHAFDPQGILNPGKIFDPPPVDQDLRAQGVDADRAVPTVFRWERGWAASAAQCQGAGVCLKAAGRGAMCPTYQATRDERHATRGRANLLRQALTRADPVEALADSGLAAALELCIGCKSCRSECPANVDMARLKAEYLQQRHDRDGTPLRTRLLGEFGRMSRIAAALPQALNGVMDTPVGKRILGIHPERSLPRPAAERFSRAFQRWRPASSGGRGQALILNDPITEYYEPQIGLAAARVLDAMGYRVGLTPFVSDLRPLISAGLLRRAQARVEKIVMHLDPALRDDVLLVGLEPSELLVYRDEALDLIPAPLQPAGGRVALRAQTFEEFVAAESAAQRLGLPEPPADFGPIMLHVHCHQRALVGVDPSVAAVRLAAGAEVHTLGPGCCGMAGSFGYTREHFELSRRIGERLLGPLRDPTLAASSIVATGASCRQQIRDLLGVTPLHPAQIIEASLPRP